MDKKTVSIVVPCFNEEETLRSTFDRLVNVASDCPQYNFTYIFVDDGSRDNTWNILKSFQDASVKCLKFSRNFGHQTAVTAGIEHSDADCVVLIDADLQDPPECIPEMLKLWESGYQVVYGRRRSRQGESILKKFTAMIFYRVLNKLSEVYIPLDTGDFRVMDKSIVKVLRVMPEKDRFLRGMISWIGFKQVAYDYDRHQRFAGTSKYPLRKMIAFALDGLISFSTRPLMLSVAVGGTVAALSVVGILFVLFQKLFENSWAPGWASAILITLFIGGVQLLTIGILGEYVGRIYDEVKNRPLYIIDDNENI